MFCSHMVVAYDGSESSQRALLIAVQAAHRDPAIELSVVHVVNSQAQTAIDKRYEDDLRQGHILVDQVAKLLNSLTNPTSVYLIKGIPQEEIVKFAYEQADLIIVGSGGETGRDKLGRVSRYVVQNSPIPTIIAI